MKDKIISFVIWLILWGIIVYGYTYYTKPTMWGPGMWGTPPTMNVENMSDEQLERMATRVGMTKDELKKEIESGKDIRTIMQEKWVGFGWRWTRTWSWKTE